MHISCLLSPQRTRFAIPDAVTITNSKLHFKLRRFLKCFSKAHFVLYEAEKRIKSESHSYSGTYGISYAGGFGENASLLRQNFEFRRKLSNERTLRFSGQTFKFFQTDESENSEFAAWRNRSFQGRKSFSNR